MIFMGCEPARCRFVIPAQAGIQFDSAGSPLLRGRHYFCKQDLPS
jgi:hypothetical protein